MKKGDDEQYQNLMGELITRYRNDLDGQKDVDKADQLDRVTEEVKELKRLLKTFTKAKETA